jgi:aminopeptidase N
MAKTDKDTEVRSAAIVKLAETGDQTYKSLVLESLKDRSYKVIAAGIDGLAKLAPQESIAALSALDADTKDHIAPSIASLYISDPKDEHQVFYENIMLTGDRNKVFAVVGQYFQYLRANINPAVTEKGIKNISDAIERLKLQSYLNKQLAGAYTAAAQAKTQQATLSSGSIESISNLSKQADLFKKGAADLGKE